MDIVLVLVVLLIIVLIWRGPKMLPKLGESFGRTVKGVRENLPGVDGDSDDSTSEGDSDPKSGS